MNVSLTPELERFIHEKVRQGSYQTASEVIREALRLLAESDQRRSLELQRLQAEINVGLKQIDRGQIGPLDVRKIKAEGRKRLSARRLKKIG